MEADLQELWDNTYLKGRKTSDVSRTEGLGQSHLETAHLLRLRKLGDLEASPSCRYFLGPCYGQFLGARNMGRGFCGKYMKQFRNIFEIIRSEGYNPEKGMLEVVVIDGETYLADGHRRLASMTALGGQGKIQVSNVRNKYWIIYVKKLVQKCIRKSYLASQGRKVLYQPIMHPAFSCYSTEKHNTSYRNAVNIISDYFGSVKGKKILDVGSCYGYYSFELARAGAFVVAIDNDLKRVDISRKTAILHGLDWSNPLFVHGSIEPFIEETPDRFDCALMLNVFHHIYNKPNGWKTLNSIANKSDKVLLSMDHAHPLKIGGQKDIPHFIESHSNLKLYEDLGSFMFSRRLYVFGK